MSAGRVRRAGRWWTGAGALAVVLYGLVLAASPLLHHDLSCELKSRTHCSACASAVAGPGLAQVVQPAVHDLVRGPALAPASISAPAAPPAPFFRDRSPPVA